MSIFPIEAVALVLPDEAKLLPVSTPRWFDRPFKLLTSTPALWFFALIPHAVAILFALKGIVSRGTLGNLSDFLNASREMLKGNDIYASGTGGYVYPPLIAFLYQPVAMLPDKSAGLILLAINSALSIFTLILISHVAVRRLTGRVDAKLIAAVAFFGAVCTADKIKGEFAHMETNVMMLLAFTLAMKFVDSAPWLCGMALGFAFNIKYMPLVLVPFLLIRRRWAATAWFAIWSFVFAILPATTMGWHRLIVAWNQATGGMFRLFGVPVNIAHSAHVRKVTDYVSISLTSGLARTLPFNSPGPLLVAGLIAIVFVITAAIVYWRNKLPVFRWPSIDEQKAAPFLGLFSIEWIGMLLLTVIFSPFTNTRHLYLLLDANIAAGALLLTGKGRIPRAPLALAVLVAALSVSLPPGGVKMFEPADNLWRSIGGCAWCMLGLFIVLIWTNVRYQRTINNVKLSPELIRKPDSVPLIEVLSSMPAVV